MSITEIQFNPLAHKDILYLFNLTFYHLMESNPGLPACLTAAVNCMGKILAV